MSALTSRGEARHYRDDGPIVDLLELALRRRNAAASALPFTLPALLPLVVLALVPESHAAWALAAATSLAAVSSARVTRLEGSGRFDWLAPAVIRIGEYAALLRLTTLVAPDAVPACYAVLAALAYHHYDVIYRLRDRGERPPRWLRWFGLGWEGRLLAAAVLAPLGLLGGGLLVAAVVLGAVYLTDGVLGWLRSGRHAAVDSGRDEVEV